MLSTTDDNRYSGETDWFIRDKIISKAVDEYGASFSSEHGVERKNQQYYDRYTSENLEGLAQAFKASTSPAKIGATTYG